MKTPKIRFTPLPDFQPQPVATASAATPQPVVEPTGESNMPLWLMLILGIVQMVPTIAQGVVAIKKDCDLGDKQAAAQDSLKTLTTAALAVVPEADKPMAQLAADAAHSTMDTVVAGLHAAQLEAPPAASLPAAA